MQEAPDPSAVVATLIELGFTHAVWLVDTESSALYESLESANASGDLLTVTLCREGEAIPIAMGLMIGGKKPVVLIQNTGLYESGDSLRGQAIDLNLPLVMMVSYRGWRSDPTDVTDSAAKYLEPVLDAYGVPHWLLTAENTEQLVPRAVREANDRSGPVAILVPPQPEE